ncbi:hypothetical protein ACET3Z_005061 [Daucus carota]
MEIDGEKVLASVAFADEMKRSDAASRTVKREAEIAKGKEKGKLVEYEMNFMPIGDGEEFYSEQAAVFMISDNEIVKHHQDE